MAKRKVAVLTIVERGPAILARLRIAYVALTADDIDGRPPLWAAITAFVLCVAGMAAIAKWPWIFNW